MMYVFLLTLVRVTVETFENGTFYYLTQTGGVLWCVETLDLPVFRFSYSKQNIYILLTIVCLFRNIRNIDISGSIISRCLSRRW
jgi:hypothetical protein